MSHLMLIVFPLLVLSVHSHVQVIHVLFVHTFNGDLASLSRGDLQEVLVKLVAFGLMSYDRLCFCFSYVLVCHEPATSSSQTHHNRMLKEREICQSATNTVTSEPCGRMMRLTWVLMHPISMSSKFAKPVLAIWLSKCPAFPESVTMAP